MEEFIKAYYILITYSVEFLAALTGIFVYSRYKFSVAKYFIWFLVYLTFFDFISSYTWHVHENGFLKFLIGSIFEKNHWLATTYWQIGAIVFFTFYYVKILETSYYKSILILLVSLFLGYSFFKIITNWDDFFHSFFLEISIIGGVIIVVCVVFYFIEVLQSDKILTFYRSLNFYISFTIFIWWLIITPLTFFNAYHFYEIGNLDRDWNFIFLRRQIYLFSNIFMYLTFTFALIWCRPKRD